jgi:hypothetical protein
VEDFLKNRKTLNEESRALKQALKHLPNNDLFLEISKPISFSEL